MSRGVFTILDSTIGKQDKVILATDLLNARLKAINEERIQANMTAMLDGQPPKFETTRANVADIERTHKFYPVHIYRPYVAMAFEYMKRGTEGGAAKLISGSGKNIIRINFSANNGQFLSDMVLHVTINAFGEDYPLNVVPPIKYKYCDYPGIRMIRRITLKHAEQIVDEYYTEDVLTHNYLRVPTNKRGNWDDCMGQEEIYNGEYYHKDFNTTEVIGYKNGYQTVKPRQDKLELWIPLLFWFNQSYEQAYFNSLVVNEQKYLEIELAPLDEIIEAHDPVTNAIVPLPFSTINIDTFDLYTKNIWMNPEIHDLFVNRSYRSIIRIYKRQKKICNMSSGRILLNDLKYLIEQMSFGFRPNENTLSFNEWWRFSYLQRKEMPIPAVIYNPLVVPIYQLVIRTSVFKKSIPTIDRLSLILHGNYLYRDFDSSFFNRYLPFQFDDIASPEDSGVYFMPFNLNDKIDPSGYTNFSTAREIYIDYSGQITSANPATFYLTAKTLALFEYTNGTALLSYFT